MKRPGLELYYWTDSSNALSWIKRAEQWTTFIADTVKDMQLLSNPDDWHHVQETPIQLTLPTERRSV